MIAASIHFPDLPGECRGPDRTREHSHLRSGSMARSLQTHRMNLDPGIRREDRMFVFGSRGLQA
jgi:hypothetical protein